MDYKIAIITACYNTEPDFLTRHFYSVAIQKNYDDILHVVVDDCSTREDTRLSLYINCTNYRNKLLISNKKNMGPGGARNRAIAAIKDLNIDYICLLDSDDYLEKDSIVLRSNYLDVNKDIIAVYGNKNTATAKYIRSDIDNSMCWDEVSKTQETVEPYNKAKLFRECYIPSCSIMFRAKPFLKHIAGFREDVRLCEDWLVWRKLALLGKIEKINIDTYTQVLHGKNLTQNNEVLQNHLKDMITTKADLDQWIRDDMDILTL